VVIRDGTYPRLAGEHERPLRVEVALPKAGHKVRAAETPVLPGEESDVPILSVKAGQHNRLEKRGTTSPEIV
jgi:hypothetical protein